MIIHEPSSHHPTDPGGGRGQSKDINVFHRALGKSKSKTESKRGGYNGVRLSGRVLGLGARKTTNPSKSIIEYSRGKKKRSTE